MPVNRVGTLHFLVRWERTYRQALLSMAIPSQIS
jgi:hypothetical protein